MSILLDTRGYLGLRPILKSTAESLGIEFSVEDLNGRGWGDIVVFGIDGVYSAEIKEWGEHLGNVDHLIEQTKKQVVNADFAYVFFYGEQMAAEDGTYSMKLQGDESVKRRNPGTGLLEEVAYKRIYRRRRYNQNYQGHRKILWRFRKEGIHVVECRDLTELANELCWLEQTATTVGTTFSKLNPQKFRIAETDEPRRSFMLTLMGIQGAGIGEELADAIASFTTSLWWLAREMESEEACRELAAIPLRNGKRRVGEAAVKKLRKALGVEA